MGTQLTRQVGPLANHDGRVLMIEAREFARRHPYHPHKLTLVFSAMRHFRDALVADGYEVSYRQAETFGDAFESHFDDRPDDELVVMRPASHGGGDRLRTLATEAGGSLRVVENETFLCSPATFDEWAGDAERLRHESFYRFMRRETDYLVDDGEPVGGEWNCDEQNRETPSADYEPPAPPTFEPDETTRAVGEWVADEFAGGYDEQPYGGDWADPEPFRWPVTRDQALEALDAFVATRLPTFGPYQDAMVEDEWAMNHSLLSAALNLGLLTPAEVVERVLAAYHDRSVPLNSVEGFVRQVIGWREFVRHVYRRTMPELARANQLDESEPLPTFYWTGETDMACLSDVIDGVRARGYSHHIERLMILANFALIYGVEPAQLNRWFHAAYVDAYHWVTTPNVVEMGLFGAGAFATKPYASSANYVDKMSDYCSGCPYAKTKTTGENACPFNALYWDFLDRNEAQLRANHRMGLMYHQLDNKDEGERTAISERAAGIRNRAESGRL
nr:cryptochrome/photolyase family protein [Halorientalis brevis]